LLLNSLLITLGSDSDTSHSRMSSLSGVGGQFSRMVGSNSVQRRGLKQGDKIGLYGINTADSLIFLFNQNKLDFIPKKEDTLHE